MIYGLGKVLPLARLFVYLSFSLQASDIWFLSNGSWLAQHQTAEPGPVNDPDSNFPLGSLTPPHHYNCIWLAFCRSCICKIECWLTSLELTTSHSYNSACKGHSFQFQKNYKTILQSRTKRAQRRMKKKPFLSWKYVNTAWFEVQRDIEII